MRPLLLDRTAGGGFDFGSGAVFTGSSMFALGLGYGVHRHVVVGGRLGLAFDRLRLRSDADMDAPDDFTVFRYFGGVFTPYIEILPIPRGAKILPYFLFRTGIAGTVRREPAPRGRSSSSRGSRRSPPTASNATARSHRSSASALVPTSSSSRSSLSTSASTSTRWIFTALLHEGQQSSSDMKADWARSHRRSISV